jgi:hypothetical protein
MFFPLDKQNLTSRAPPGGSENAVLTQIRVALCIGGRISAPGVSVLRRGDSRLAPYGNGSLDRHEYAVARSQGGF